MDSRTKKVSQGGKDFAAIRAEFALPNGFSPAALAEAEQAATGAGHSYYRRDATDLPLVTIDPPGAKDLDQALAIDRHVRGFRVYYAIADLAAVVLPGGALDGEVRQRGQTHYLPDGNIPLHPTVLSEGIASLLPGEQRAAVLWTIDLDAEGQPVDVSVERALVRSLAQLDYLTVQAAFDAGQAHPAIAALPELGQLRRNLAVARGAIELALPEQQIEPDGVDQWRISLRPRNEVELWNAEISLLTGMCAAQLMLQVHSGILRTLPEAPVWIARDLRKSAKALGIPWESEQTAAEVLARLAPQEPSALALFSDATKLLRGARYTTFVDARPDITTHSGIGAPYAHVTAPLRRLVDRFAAEVCLAASANTAIPEWVLAALPELPGIMGDSDRLASQVERACIDQVESWLLSERIGETFPAMVLRANAGGIGEIFLVDPPVLAKCTGENLVEGKQVLVKLIEADPVKRNVMFSQAE